MQYVTLLLLICLFLFLSVGTASARETKFSSMEAPWKQQLAYMQYLVLRTSNINLVKALGLSTKQRILLHDIANTFDEHVAIPRPNGSVHFQYRKIVRTFEEVERVLLNGKPISEDLRRAVIGERTREANLLRKGLRYWADGESCLRCHGSPNENLDNPDVKAWTDRCRYSPVIVTDMDTMHNEALVGYKGMMYLWAAAEDADKVLNEAQKKLIDEFNCCILPVADLEDPLRVGQIAASNEAIEALEKTRRVPKLLMFWAKKIVTNHMTHYAKMVNPGLTKEQARIMRRRVRSVLYKARRLSRVDFELQKHALARELTDVSFSKALPPQLLRYRRALMLFVPGSAELYAPEAN